MGVSRPDRAWSPNSPSKRLVPKHPVQLDPKQPARNKARKRRVACGEGNRPRRSPLRPRTSAWRTTSTPMGGAALARLQRRPHPCGRPPRSRAIQPGDEDCLLFHVSALKPCQPDFLDDLNDYQAAHGLPALTTADLDRERVMTILRARNYARTWRWRVLIALPDERFIINDRDLCEFSDIDPRTGTRARRVLPARSDRRPPRVSPSARAAPPPPSTTRLFRPSRTQSRLRRAAKPPLVGECRAVHRRAPSDRKPIECIDDGADISYDLNGPYRFRSFGFFGD